MLKIHENSLLNFLELSLKTEGISRIVVGGLIKNKDGEILVLKRSEDDFMGGLDELPSGKKDPVDKTVYDALIREIKEETNLDVSKIESYLGSFDYKSKSGILTRQFNFAVEVSDTKALKISEEHQNSTWYSIYKIHLSNMTDNVREFLNKEFENQLIEQATKEDISRFVVGGLICNDQNQVLVLKRSSNDFLGGLDELPSGKVEKDERLYEALIREIKEETNLKVTEPVKRYIGHFDYKSKSGILTRQFNFEVLVEDISQIKISEEHESYNWYSDATKETLNVSENVINVINNFFPPPQKRKLSCQPEKISKRTKKTQH